MIASMAHKYVKILGKNHSKCMVMSWQLDFSLIDLLLIIFNNCYNQTDFIQESWKKNVFQMWLLFAKILVHLDKPFLQIKQF